VVIQEGVDIVVRKDIVAFQATRVGAAKWAFQVSVAGQVIRGKVGSAGIRAIVAYLALLDTQEHRELVDGVDTLELKVLRVIQEYLDGQGLVAGVGYLVTAVSAGSLDKTEQVDTVASADGQGLVEQTVSMVPVAIADGQVSQDGVV
jgi:hypothetical protein